MQVRTSTSAAHATGVAAEALSTLAVGAAGARLGRGLGRGTASLKTRLEVRPNASRTRGADLQSQGLDSHLLGQRGRGEAQHQDHDRGLPAQRIRKWRVATAPPAERKATSRSCAATAALVTFAMARQTICVAGDVPSILLPGLAGFSAPRNRRSTRGCQRYLATSDLSSGLSGPRPKALLGRSANSAKFPASGLPKSTEPAAHGTRVL